MGPSRMISLLAWDIPSWVKARSPSGQGYTKGSVQVQQGLKHGEGAAIKAGSPG